jgi:Tol biopolymer transport system component
LAAGGTRRLTPIGYFPKWSPTGPTIAFVHPGAQPTSASQVRLVSATTGRTRILLDGLKFRLAENHPAGEHYGVPMWSPDGKRLAAPVDRYFVDDEDGPRSYGRYVRISDLKGRTRTLDVELLEVEWSPDGRQLVGTGPAGISVVSVVTGKARRLIAEDNRYLYNPRWSPDGQLVAFIQCDEYNENCALTMVRADGKGAPRRIARILGHMDWDDPMPDWRPR